MIVAILGLGSIGLRHARNVLGLGHEVVGFDPAPVRLALLQEIGGQPAATRESALEQSEAVIVASPNKYHLEDLAAAIAARRHVMVEKPLAHRLDGVPALLDAADASQLCVFAALNLRFHPAVQGAKALIDAGRIGQPIWARLICASYLPSWRPATDYRSGYAADPATGGVLFDIIHEFDLVVHLLGPAQTVAATARNTGLLELPSEDSADVIMRHASGVVSSIHLDYVTRPARRRTEIAGTAGLLEIDVARRELVLLDMEGNVIEKNSYPPDFNADYVAETVAFLRCVTSHQRPTCTGREAYEVLRQVVRAREMSGLPA